MEKQYIININTLPDPEDNPAVMEGLPTERANKCLMYHKADDRKRCLGAGMIINEITKGQPLSYGTNGKPTFKDICFNVSHSGDYVIGFSSKIPIGCDIEKISDAPLEVASQYFSPSEIKYIEESPDKNYAFWQLWTLKESYMKMTGEGMQLELDKFEVIIDKDIIFLFRDGEKQDCELKCYEYNNHMIAICKQLCEKSQENL